MPLGVVGKCPVDDQVQGVLTEQFVYLFIQNSLLVNTICDYNANSRIQLNIPNSIKPGKRDLPIVM